MKDQPDPKTRRGEAKKVKQKQPSYQIRGIHRKMAKLPPSLSGVQNRTPKKGENYFLGASLKKRKK